MDRRLSIVLVAAVAENGIIGAGNTMPWHIPSDLKHFKALTLGRPVIMGRKTFESLGRPLPGRFNIVVSRGAAQLPEGVARATSLEEALGLAAQRAEQDGVDEIMVIGGGQLYAAALPLADRLEISRVHAEPEGDTVFPEIDAALWTVKSAVPGLRDERDTAEVSYLTFERRLGPADTSSLITSGRGDDRHDT
ncbi:dihydrofolate reductase [Pannonibacter carbonis]|uniref:dihydrofolate reductase n=1 Tax=Pannonibacter carbonis TaxID=2067569 RepID=UPI000D109B53|nr:dihydrofolate reductase [Pannonibacter carbonis]